MQEALAGRVVVAAAGRDGLFVAVGELQAAADRQRFRLGLTKADDARAWLARQCLTVDGFEASVERALLAEKFRRHLLPPYP